MYEKTGRQTIMYGAETWPVETGHEKKWWCSGCTVGLRGVQDVK